MTKSFFFSFQSTKSRVFHALQGKYKLLSPRKNTYSTMGTLITVYNVFNCGAKVFYNKGIYHGNFLHVMLFTTTQWYVFVRVIKCTL